MTAQEKTDTIKEAKILEALRHPNIIRFREVYKTKRGKLCIVMDYAEKGDLNQLLKLGSLTEKQVLDFFTQACLAIKHVHDRKVIHRDIKSQNIFVDRFDTVKLGDFGIAKVLKSTMAQANTLIGTPYYLSPEIIDNQPYSFAADIWSLGILLYELCMRTPPFTAGNIQALALKIVAGHYPPISPHFSSPLTALIDCMLQT